MSDIQSSPRLWLLPLVLLLFAGSWWLLDSGILGGVAEGIQIDEGPAGSAAENAEEDGAAKEVLGREDSWRARRRLGSGGDAEASATFGIEGRVVDVRGKGLSGVTVTAYGSAAVVRDMPESARMATVLSGEDGVFRLDEVRGRGILLAATIESGGFGTVTLNRRPVAGWIRDCKVVLVEGRKVRGRVLDEQGKPIAGAWVLPHPVKDWRYRWWRLLETRSDAAGRFEIGGMPQSAFQLSVWARGYRLALRYTDESQPVESLEIRLVRGTEIALPCHIGAEGKVLAEILTLDPQVSLSFLEHEGRRWRLPSPFLGRRFDEAGRCLFEGLVAGKVRASFQALGTRVWQKFHEREMREGEKSKPIVWEAAWNQPLGLRLLDDRERPLKGIVVSYRRGNRRVTYRSDEEGKIFIEDFAPAERSRDIKLVSPGWYFTTERGLRTTLRIRVGPDRVARLKRGPSIAGLVLKADGRPASGAVLSLLVDESESRELIGVCRCDVQGRFGMTLKWRKTTIKVRLVAELKSQIAVHAQPLTLRPSSRIDGITIHLQEGASLKGRMLLPDRRPAEEAGLLLVPLTRSSMVHWNQRRHSRYVHSDGLGKFHFEGLPAGRYKLVGSKLGLYFPQGPFHLDLKIGTQHDLGSIVLKKGLEIAGKLLDLEGKPHPEEVRVVASMLLQVDSAETKRYHRYANVAEDGGFRIEGLMPGKHELHFGWKKAGNIQAPEGSSRLFNRSGYKKAEAEAGQTGLEFRFPRSGFGNLELRIRSSRRGWVPSHVHLLLESRGKEYSEGVKLMAVDQGLVAIKGVGSGRYLLRVRHSRFGRWAQEVLIRKGQTCKAELDLGQRTGEVELHVRDEQGQVIAGAWVGLFPPADHKAVFHDPWGLYSRGTGSVNGRYTSDGQGRAWVLPAAAKESLVMVWQRGFVPFAQSVRAGSSLIRATLRKSSEVRFQITKKTLGKGGPREYWQMKLWLLESEVKDHDPRLDKGIVFPLFGTRRHRLDTLPPGRYRLEGRRWTGKRWAGSPEEREIRTEFRLEAGKPLDLDL